MDDASPGPARGADGGALQAAAEEAAIEELSATLKQAPNGANQANNGADVGEFFKDVKDLNPKKLDKWVESVAEDINGKVDLPMLNEDQEQGVIELVLKVVAEKFCGAGKKCLQGKSKWF